MYQLNDKPSAIKEIQRFLYVISQKEKTLPHVSIDGYYGDETRLAVLEFQRLNFLEESGTVEKETYDTLYKTYLEILDEINASENGLNSESFPLKLGDSGNDVSILNSILRELCKYYKEISPPYEDFFSRETEESVKQLQRHLLEEESGTVTESFLGKLKKEADNRKSFKTN